MTTFFTFIDARSIILEGRVFRGKAIIVIKIEFFIDYKIHISLQYIASEHN